MILFEILRGYDDAVSFEVLLSGYGQKHIPIDAAAGIPAAAGNRVVNADSDDVFTHTVKDQLIGEVKGKGGIAIGMTAEHSVVYRDFGIHIHPFKFEDDTLVLHGFFKYQALFIDPLPAGKKAALRFEIFIHRH